MCRKASFLMSVSSHTVRSRCEASLTDAKQVDANADADRRIHELLYPSANL
jgi:hypothetical protein